MTAQADTVIVGASAAGLAVAACLKREGVPFILLDKAARVGATWRGHYDRLHLVVVTGHARVPNRPAWPGQEAFEGEVLHSSRYRSGAAR